MANLDNIEAGETDVWMFSEEDLRGKEGERGTGLPGSKRAAEEREEGGHVELPLPRPARWLIRFVVCPLAKLVGYKPTYSEYRSRGG